MVHVPALLYADSRAKIYRHLSTMDLFRWLPLHENDHMMDQREANPHWAAAYTCSISAT
jgi:hypothetical protein